MKKQEANQKHERLEVTVKDKNTGEIIYAGETGLFAGVIDKGDSCRTLIVGGGNYNTYVNIAKRLTQASGTMIKHILARLECEKED